MTITLDTVAQSIITVAGLTSIILIAKKNKWGFVFALIAQPFWFVTTYIHRQWGLFILSFAYAISWLYGFYQWFFRDERNLKKVQKADERA